MKRIFLFIVCSVFTVGCMTRTQPIVTNNSTPQFTSTPAQNVRRIDGPITYVAVGDSTAVGVGGTQGGYVAVLFKNLQQARPGSQLKNFGISGSTTAEVLAQQIEKAIAAKPQLVTVSVGVNDIRRGVTPEEFGSEYDQLLKRLSTETSAVVVVSNLPDVSSSERIPPLVRSQTQALIGLFNERLREVATAHNVPVFDTYQLTHEQLGQHPEYFSADGFHPSDAGYELWANRMWPVVAKALGL